MEMREESIAAQGAEMDLTPDTNQATEPVYETADVVEQTADGDGGSDDVRPERVVYASAEDALEAARVLAGKDAGELSREELSNVKQQFYAFRNAERPAPSEDGVEVTEPIDVEFREVLDIIKEKKAAHVAQLEAEREANLARREAIIEELRAMSTDADNVNREFPRFKELQQEFKEIGEVPATAATAQWKRYQDAVEHFYDQYRINKDLRDYDFKKNLDTKNALCNEAEELASEEDVVTAFRRLQVLHDTWRDTGPVAKELREDIWNRFKDASAVVNKRYQAYFEERKAREQLNESAKTAICERVEALDLASVDNYKAWDEMTALILSAQEEWRSLGYASPKNNNKLFSRFRSACDNFFNAKAAFYKGARDKQNENLALKTALCEQAEALKDSTEWKKTADKLVELQRKWKSIGAVPRKHSDALWARFQQACDYFFEQKKKDLSELRQSEQAALKAKREIIAELGAVGDDLEPEAVSALLKDADRRWRGAGHVPFKEKDKVYAEYRAMVDALYERFKLTRMSRSMARFETSLADMGGDSSRIGRERERIVRAYEAKSQELKTCENNLGFFTTKSGRGNAMLQEMERRIAAIKEEIETLRAKIKLLDERI